MADNKLLLKRGSDEDFLADDDPLAELARIVGFDAAPSPKPAPAARREPVFDLEDELLKELEIYSRPAEPDVAAAPEPVTQPAPDLASAPSLAPVDERELSPPAVTYTDPELEAFVRPPVVLEAVETLAAPDGGRVYDRPASHPVFDLEDEILREFAAFDARSVSSQTERVVEAEVVHQIEPSLADLPAELHDVPELGARPQPQGRELYDSLFDDDLHAAIGDAVAQSLGEPMQTVAEPILDTVSDQEAPFEGIEDAALADVGNWPEPVEVAETALDHAAADHGRDRDDAPSSDHTLAAAPVADAEAGIVEPVLQPSLEPWEVRAEVAPVLATDQELPAVADAQADTAAAPTSFSAYPPVNDYGLDDLLAEVERFPVGDASGRWGVQSKPAAPADLDRVSAPVARDFAPIPSFPEPDFTEAVAAQTMGDHRGDPAMSAGDSLPDIDLEAVEAELLEAEDEEFSLSPDLLSAISGDLAADEVPPVEAEVDRVAPVQAEVVSSSFAAVERPAENADYSTLPFDPSQVIQEEDVVEAIAEMDVPDVQTVQEEERPAPHPEYDIDLDAEMAQLFVTASAPAASSVRGVQASDAVAGLAGSQKAPPANLDLDEFERALEEDFRRSFSENRATSNPDRVPLAPVAAVSASNPRRRTFLLAGVAAVIAVVGGAGVFAFMSGDATMITPSDPKVILADTDPVKVVPENPGGKEVPNQNKAVYDRVAGAKVDETKQESLVTSNEEPIDVVQRTLEPENLPMDDDAMAMATPTDDTADPRLLPDDAEQERVTTTSKVLSGVSPRKVKTMVVRPDGTLVEREVTEEDVKQQASNDAELMKIAQKAAQDAATATDSQADDIAKAIEDVPERLAPTDEKTVTPAESRQSTVEDVATEAEPVTEPVADPVDTVMPESEQPVVAEDVADEPAVAAAETDLEPSEATVAADKPTDRSLPADDQQAAADTEAAAKLAEAQVPATDSEVEDAPVRKVKTVKITPVPEVRPVDQPVNVVGTVNDQGAVQDAVEEKPQQVALADQNAEAPAAATPLPAGSYVIQIASLPSEAEAEASYSKLSTKFGGIIGGKGVDIRKAEIKNKGTYYRVRIPAGSKQEAQNLCAQYKKAGGSCLVSK